VALVLLGAGRALEPSVTAEEAYERAAAAEGLGRSREAAYWYRRAARLGHAAAQVEVALLYDYGRSGLLRDPAEARRWIRQAAGSPAPSPSVRGLPEGIGRSGVPRDAAEAAQWYGRAVASCRQAAAHGDLQAQTLLAFLYGAGKGVSQDRQEALRLWGEAARQGYPPAQLALAQLHHEAGRYEAAYPWLRQAARGGQAEAAYGLSLAHQLGQGAGRDPAEALRWLRHAARLGSTTARRQLRSMEAQGLL
jgi:TPR repeat protein